MENHDTYGAPGLEDLVNHVAHLPPVPPRRPAPSIKPSLSSNAVAGTNQH